MATFGKRQPRAARLKLEGDHEGVIVNLVYRPDAVGFDEKDLPRAIRPGADLITEDEDEAEDPAEDGSRFYRYMAALIESWDVEGPVQKDVYIDGRVQSVEVLPEGLVEITPENMRLLGGPICNAIHARLLDHVMGNRSRKQKR